MRLYQVPNPRVRQLSGEADGQGAGVALSEKHCGSWGGVAIGVLKRAPGLD